MTVSYLHLPCGHEPPPSVDRAPFKAVVVLEQPTTDAWRAKVSTWLVQNGCLYMMAWGPDSSAWDDSVDMANLEAFDFADIPDEHAVMTTWHDHEPLSETFWFAGRVARHSELPLQETLIIHVGANEQRASMLQAFARAQDATDREPA